MPLEPPSVNKADYGPVQLRESEEDNESAIDAALLSGSRRGWSSRRAFFSMTFISGVAVGLVFGYLFGRLTTVKHVGSLEDFGMDLNMPLPTSILKNRKNVPFIPHREWMGPSEEATKNWENLTKGSDSIFIPNPPAYGLQDPGIHAPFFIFNEPPSSAARDTKHINNFYVLNNLHELHCVNMIRKRYNALVYDANNTQPLADTTIDRDWISHLEHCFEYLRLSITCGDFMMLESDSPPGSPREYWEDGLSWGVVHSCIDWDGLMEFQHHQVSIYNRTWKV